MGRGEWKVRVEGWKYLSSIIHLSFQGMNIVKGSLEQKTLVMRTATSKIIYI